LHLVLHDADNKSAVIEWYNGKEFIYDESSKQYNPDTIRVLTNDPSFISQTTAARQFSALTRKNHFKASPNDVTTPDDKFLPGDSSSGSRFVRLFKLNKAMGGKASECYAPEYPYSLINTCQKPPLWRVQLANKIIARAEEVYGEYPDANPLGILTSQDAYFHTNFTVIRDHSNQNLYVRGVYNSTLRKVSLKELFKKMDSTSKNLYQYVDPLPNGECPSTDSAGINYKLMCFQNVNGLFSEALPDQ
jgi:penicillin V acylase-like amidase (Ntn superfamily)